MNINQIVEAVSNLTNQTDLNRVAEAINQARSIRSQRMCLQFCKGDSVSFVHKGTKIVGTVDKVNRKTIGIVTNGQGNWRVAPSFLVKE